MEGLERTLQRMVRDYQSFNSSAPDVLHRSPTALEFAQKVHLNRPLIIRGEGSRYGQMEQWSEEYLVRRMEERLLDITVTPDGRADSIVDGQFVMPANVKLTMQDFFQQLHEGAKDPTVPVLYLSSQNGNIRGAEGDSESEYAPLLDDVGAGPDWAREVFGESAEATNLWIGDFRSVTSMHKDPFENIYLVVKGSKTFSCLPPSEYYCLHEKPFPAAQLSFTPPSIFSTTLLPLPPVPWIPLNPLSPDLSLYPRFSHARPTTFTLNEGDCLYLPSFWFHSVQNNGELAIAVNWWTDMRFDGVGYTMNSLVRRLTGLLDGIVEAESDED